MKTKKNPTKKDTLGCGLLLPGKKEKPYKPLPTAEADAVKIEQLTQKLKLFEERSNELVGCRVALKQAFPGRVFDPYMPSAILQLVSELKKHAEMASTRS